MSSMSTIIVESVDISQPQLSRYASVMPKLLLIPLDDTVVFPGMTVTLPVDVGDETRVLLVPRHGNDYASVGVVAEVGERMRLPGRIRAVLLSGAAPRHRRRRRDRSAGPPVGRGRGAPRRDSAAASTRELEREYRAVVEEILELRGDDGRVSRLRALDHRARRAGRHVGLLARPDLRAEGRAARRPSTWSSGSTLALRCSASRLAELQVRKRIREDVESGAQKQQREYFLRRQMDSIRKELGEDDASVAEEYRTQDRRGRHARRRPRAGRARARPARADGRASPASRR